MRKDQIFDHLILLIGVAIMIGPIAVLVGRMLQGLDMRQLWDLISTLWTQGIGRTTIGANLMMWNSMVLAVGLAALKCVLSLMAAYALVFFRLPAREYLYGAILITMFFPIETRILPSFHVTSELGLLNSYTGMILPVAASGLGVLLFRQFLQQLPPEVMEAARMDGAGPLRSLKDIILPLSLPMVASLFSILFVLGWNQYVWPIMVTTNSQSHDTLVRGMEYAGFAGKSGMALALLSLLPPGIVLIAAQRWMLRGLTTGIH